MNGLLLSFLLLQAAPQATGVVTGVVRANGQAVPGVRVYAISARDTAAAGNSPAALESLTETDSSGRYRLEVPAGRYHIASGAVTSPTYFPGTTDLAAARIVVVTAGGLAENVDFSGFVPAARNPVSALPTRVVGSGVLSGVIRYPDGTPAAGITVAAASKSAPAVTPGVTLAMQVLNQPPGAPSIFLSTGAPVFIQPALPAVTDLNGRYRIENLAADTYYIAAGFADAPTYFPGTPDLSFATTITTTATTRLDTIDFTVQRPVPIPGTTLSGKVVDGAGAPAAGAAVRMRYIVNRGATPSLILGLPASAPTREIPVGLDGAFEFRDVRPGAYAVEALVPGVQVQNRSVVVADQPVTGVTFSFPVVMLSGRLLMEDGSPLPDPQAFKEARVSTVGNPNLIQSTIFPISSAGTFARVMEAGEYRFYVRYLPDRYVIRSMTSSGGADLLKERLILTGKETVRIEVRVGRRDGSSPTQGTDPGVKVSGTVLDAVSSAPSNAESVTLCCRDSGPAQGFSTAVRPDGSFEFAAVPSGQYDVGLEARSVQQNLLSVTPALKVADQAIAGLELKSATSLVRLTASIVLEGGGRLPPGSTVRVAFHSFPGALRIEAVTLDAMTAYASVPVGNLYGVMVEPPAGYTLKSINGSTNPADVRIPAIAGTPIPPSIVITLAPTP
jgi:hypothetical protein